jgi:hypothetical protein
VEVRERREDAIAEDGQDPPLGEEHALLHLGLVAGVMRARRQDGGAVVLREVGVRRVELGVVVVGPHDPGLRVVGHQRGRHAAAVREGVHVAADPRGQILAQHGLDVGEVTRAEHEDEEHGRPRAGHRIDDRESGAAEVDEALRAGAVTLPQGHRQRARPGGVAGAELAVLVARRLVLPILLPDEELRHVRAAQLLVDRRPVGRRSRRYGMALGRKQEPGQRRIVVERGRQRPGDLRHRDPAKIAAHRADREPTAPRDRPRREPDVESQAEDFAKFAHGDPLCRHHHLLVEVAGGP